MKPDFDDVLPPALMDGAPEWANELDQAIMAGAEWPAEQMLAFEVTSPELAEWAMRNAAVLRRREISVGTQAEAYRARIDRWERGELERVTEAVEFFSGLLKRWALREREKDPRRATFKLPSGQVATRSGSEPVVKLAVDKTFEPLVEWLAGALSSDEYEEVVKTKPEVLISKLAKLVRVDKQLGPELPEDQTEGERGTIYTVVLASTGELVPYLTVEMPATTASVTVDLP